MERAQARQLRVGRRVVGAEDGDEEREELGGGEGEVGVGQGGDGEEEERELLASSSSAPAAAILAPAPPPLASASIETSGGTTPSSGSSRFLPSSERASLPTSPAASALSSAVPKLSRFTAALILTAAAASSPAASMPIDRTRPASGACAAARYETRRDDAAVRREVG